MYQPVPGPTGPSSYSSAPQQSQQTRIQSYQNGLSTTGQWASPQGRRLVSGGMSNALPLIQYRDRDKDNDKERTERDVTGRMDYRLDTRTSDRVPQSKKEPIDGGKLVSPPSAESKIPTPSAIHAPSTGITPVSASSSRPYSPPPSQPPSGPRAGTGAPPPTGPRGGPPPTGPRAGVDRESRKDADRKWGSKERGGSAEYWNNAPPPQAQHTHPQPQSQPAPVKQPAVGPTLTRLDTIGHVHPDRIKEIETAVQGEDDRDRTHTHIPQHVSEQPASYGNAEPSTQRPSSTTCSGPPGLGSRQGISIILNPAPSSGYASASTAQPPPTAPASISNSPTKVIQPPTAPRALQQASGARGSLYWRGGRSFRGSGNFGPVVKREVGDDGTGYRNGRGNGGMGMSTGTRDLSVGKGGRIGSRAGVDVGGPVVREDFEMLDAHAHVGSEGGKRPGVSPDGLKSPEVTGAPVRTERNESALGELLPSFQSQLTPIVKIEDDLEEEDDDVSLTQADVAFKIADIDKDIECLEKRLVDLSKRKADHLAEVAKIDKELIAEAARSRSPKTMEPEVEVSREKAVIEIELDKPQIPRPELQHRLVEDHDMQQQEERKQEERVEQQLQAQFHQQQNQQGMEFDRSEGVLGTAFISPSPTPSASNSPTSSEDPSDGSLRNGSNNRHPDLPFFRPGPPMKPSDYDFYQNNIEEHEHMRGYIVAHISEERKGTYEKEIGLKRKFRELWEPWYEKCQDMDKDATRKKKGASEPAEMGTSPVLTAVMAPEAVGRRAGRNAPSDVVRSEAEMEQVLKGLAEEEQQKAADTKSKDQNAREALIPDMIMDPGEMLIFRDTNRLLRTNEDVLAFFQYNVPPDAWGSTEQKIFCEQYALFPKQWGKIAQEIEGRDFKACILHYYMTKKTCNYKELVRGPPGKRGSRKGRRKQASSQRTRQSALITDLGPRGGVGAGEDDEGADSEDVTPAAITETGRPKRAAAPVFGIDSSNNNNIDAEIMGTNGGNGKRGSRDSKGGDDDGERTERGTKRTRGGNNIGREKGQKRVKTPANTPAQPSTPVPIQPVLPPVLERVEEKEGKKKEDLRERESDAVSALTGMGMTNVEILPEPMVVEDRGSVIVQQLNPQVQVPIEQPMTPLQHTPTLPTTPMALPPPSTPTPKKDKGERTDKSAQTSSYWSVPEQSDFPHLLASFGTNWAMISQRLASKTTVMVGISAFTK